MAWFSRRAPRSPGRTPPAWGFDFTTSAFGPYDPAVGHGFEPGPGRLFSVKSSPRATIASPWTWAATRPRETTVKAESRRLMLETVRVGACKTETRTIVVNVRRPELGPAAGQRSRREARGAEPPARTRSYDWDGKLTLEFCGPSGRRAPAEDRGRDGPDRVPGRRSHRHRPALRARRRLGPDAAALLQASTCRCPTRTESGETLKAFLVERRLDKILSRIKRGDWLLIQFGHNDQKSQWPQTYVEAATTYRDYLRAYVGEARLRGATPYW
ncbi:hypothetical protein ACRAWD_19050 [Caulobacter segnis]